MINSIVYSMVYTGSALMVFNIYSFIRFVREIRKTGDWKQENAILITPTCLLIMFLLGYLAVGLFGSPDIIVSGILFGGSIFVCIIVYVLRRITNRVMLNERLQAELMAAEASSQAKSSFLSDVSHEMRTPMNAILGTLRLTQNDPNLSPGTRANLDRIDASARHLLSLINTVLDMNMIDSGELELRQAPFSFAEVMQQVEGMIHGSCQVKGLRYHFNRIGDVDSRFIGDELNLKKVLLCIVGNAVKFTPPFGTVSCSVEQIAADEQTRTLRFVVRDNGIGISKEFLPKVFDAFSREDTTNTAEFGGTGLGLSVARGIVEKMGGTITLESEKGVGTTVTFTVVLNAAGEDEGAAPESDSASKPIVEEEIVQLEGRRVLIVEDIDLNAEILADLLEMEGILSDRAENGQIAVDRFSACPPYYYDVILMDLRMPVMDGLEATRRIRALDRPDAKSVPILALTANAFEEDVRNCVNAGMNAHLAKPADIDFLCGALRAHLNKTHLYEEAKK